MFSTLDVPNVILLTTSDEELEHSWRQQDNSWVQNGKD